ncbi:STAS domain-containing protein [Mycobacterium mantenii]|uniref:Sulfate transporter n=1 Tax=Mycobacterium mantenii TaxID=560555 RepID=A0A1A2SZN9_MYCNT|nr:STAS domain-containing protein [Mycobacterium mantenii]OBH49394.1 sulfate transporter [Mycobacterium mantenii]OBH60976.1 sulfate transporter [Mycobacterium mantenii]OBH69541.1 sulfate transporter [Mycobacterium mantenii]OBH69677.1 sulfate transporter [Mycobacterium mantenii]
MSPVAVAMRTDDSVAVLTVNGELDAANSTALRERILKAALDDVAAVVVDVSGLKVQAESTWSTFMSAYWQVASTLHVPIVLVCTDKAAREAITRSGVAHFMPLFSSEKAAMKGLGQNSRRPVRRADVQLPADLTSLRESRRMVREWLTTWSQSKLIPVALVVVNVFVENVLEHTASVPVVRIEAQGTTATIAVSDASNTPAVRLPSPSKGIDVSGLAIVDALSRAWGSTPTASGKTVWAVIGPENQL